MQILQLFFFFFITLVTLPILMFSMIFQLILPVLLTSINYCFHNQIIPARDRLGVVDQTKRTKSTIFEAWQRHKDIFTNHNSQTVRARELKFWENVHPTPQCQTCNKTTFFLHKHGLSQKICYPKKWVNYDKSNSQQNSIKCPKDSNNSIKCQTVTYSSKMCREMPPKSAKLRHTHFLKKTA